VKTNWHVKENWAKYRLSNTEKEGVERSEERGNSGRVVGGRGTKLKWVGWGREGEGGGGGEGPGKHVCGKGREGNHA